MEQAQRVAAKVVRRVLAGSTLQSALAENAATPGNARALIHELSYGTLRFLGQVRALVRTLATRRLTDDSVEALLCVALYQLIHTRAPQHVVVDAAVRATARLKRSSAQGLTNAILRNFLRRQQALQRAIDDDPEARFSYPQWWIDRVTSEYPHRAAAILDAGNERPPLCLRVNCRALTRDDYMAALAAQHIGARPAGANAVIIDEPRAVDALPGFADGWFSVQDAGAQLAAPLLAPVDGMRVLDACAAPGGKTTHLAELANIDLVALDVDGLRLARVDANLARLKLSARLRSADVNDIALWWDGTPFERILADVPCSASGVVRRHPDAKWLRRETDISGFAAQQTRLLSVLWRCLRPGGQLLYTTCSIFRAENADVVEAFLVSMGDAVRVAPAFGADLGAELGAELAELDGQLLPAGPAAAHNHDGFFYALLQKR